MNVVDMVVVGLLIVNTILGAVRGFALQAFKLASIVLAIWLAHRFSKEFAEAVGEWLEWPLLQRQALGWVVIGAGVYLIMLTIGHYARGLLQRLRMGGADRALGALLGGLKALVICLVVLHVVTAIVSVPPAAIIPDSVTAEIQSSKAFEIYLTTVEPVSQEWTAKAREAIKNRAATPK
jgi:membrane protein required for colicin V production